MLYNANFEIVGVFVLSIMYYFLLTQYSKRSETTNAFRKFILLMILTEVLDIATAYTISYAAVIPSWVNLALNTAYFGLSLFLQFQYVRYVCSYIRQYNRQSNMELVCRYVGGFYGLVLLLNVFTGILFKFRPNGEYVKGPIYILEFILPSFFVFYTVAVVLKNKSSFRRKQIWSIILFAVFSTVGSVLQLFWFQYILLSLFTPSMGAFLCMLSLETPDYQKLMDTLEELHKAKSAAEEADKAKTEFLSSMSHEIRTPINAVLGYNTLIMQRTKDEQVLEYSRNAKEAGAALLKVVNNIFDYTDSDDISEFIETFTGNSTAQQTEGEDNLNIKLHAPNARILMADDNKMNLDLIIGLLKDTGVMIDTVEDGQQAIERLKSEEYDLIFLDHMMPVMDGIEAFREINRLGLCPDTPIIVLTANVVYGAREMYLKEGFDAYLSKPVSQKQLIKALYDFLPSDKIVNEHNISHEIGQLQKSEASSALAETFGFLDTHTGLSYCADSEEFYLEMLRSYVDNSRLDELNNYVRDENWKDYQVSIHALKSTSLSIGAEELSEEAKALENAAKAELLDYIRENHERVMDEYQQLLANIVSALDRI